MNRSLCFALLSVFLPFAIQEDIESGSCQCAVFSEQISGPIMERNLPYNVTCNDDGEKKCQQLCVVLAEASKESAPQMVCDNVNGHMKNIQAALYAKVCDVPKWKFTGLKAALPICCNEGKNIPCEEPAPVIES